MRKAKRSSRPDDDSLRHICFIDPPLRSGRTAWATRFKRRDQFQSLDRAETVQLSGNRLSFLERRRILGEYQFSTALLQFRTSASDFCGQRRRIQFEQRILIARLPGIERCQATTSTVPHELEHTPATKKKVKILGSCGVGRKEETTRNQDSN